MIKIRLPLGDRSYDILIGSRILSRAGALIRSLDARGTPRDAVIITQAPIARAYGPVLKRSLAKQKIPSIVITIPDSERAKSIAVVRRVLERIAAYDTLRRICVIALGGGVTGDLAGFVAAVYKRGVPFVQIPTTLLAQVDSAIGGKVAIDLPAAKNLAGAFYQPRLVLSDTAILASLPRRQIASGLAEIIKYGVIADKALFAFLERNRRRILALDKAPLEHIIARSSAIKARVVARDERDLTGIRAALNFGHTAGHAIEAASGYAGRYSHGEAVAAGMVIAADIALALGMLRRADRDRMEALIRECGLPVTIAGLGLRDIMRSFAHDKKFTNRKNRLVLPVRIGAVKIVEGVPEKVIAAAIQGRMRRDRR